jgi:hypothetical protein
MERPLKKWNFYFDDADYDCGDGGGDESKKTL